MSSEPQILPPPEQTQAPKPPPRTDENPQYEFKPEENATLINLASKMRFVGIFILGIGLFVFSIGVVRLADPNLIFAGILQIVTGIWTFRAGSEFKRVAQTEGRDVTHLMAALENLLRLYTLLFWLFFIALVFAIIQLAAVSVGGPSPT
jgi:hypothetical protein